MNTFMIFHGSYQVDRVETTAPIKPHYAQYRLAKEIENNPSVGFWASIKIGDIETRYAINENGEFVVIKEIDWSKIKP